MRFEVTQGEAAYSGFVNGGAAGPPPEGAPPAKNVANTNVGVFGDHLLVYFEGGLPYAMDPENLRTLGPHDFHGSIDVLCTAHYKLDPATGDMLFFAALGPQVTWYRTDATTGRITDSHRIETGLPLMIHDFAVSEHYAVFLVTPTMLRFDLLAQGLPGVIWDEAALPQGSQVILMNRDIHRCRKPVPATHRPGTAPRPRPVRLPRQLGRRGRPRPRHRRGPRGPRVSMCTARGTRICLHRVEDAHYRDGGP